MSEMNDFFKRVNQDKSKNVPIFDRNEVSNIHEKIIDRIKGGKGQEAKSSVNNPMANEVIQKDIAFREALANLTNALMKLNDKEIAMKLIGEHIFMLDSIFKDFEK